MSASALLLVMMEPPASLEDEFNDWYDTEHFPQRAGMPGFKSGSRWACVDGWPKWAATYDLESSNALTTKEYLASSGANSTPWSKRVLSRTCGRQRIIAEAVTGSDALAVESNRVSRFLIACFSGGEVNSPTMLLQAAKSRVAEREDVLQMRAYEEKTASTRKLWLTIAFSSPVSAASLHDRLGRLEGTGATLFNLYVPYVRG